jgi:hypothetical protein
MAISACGATPLYGVCSTGTRPFSDSAVPSPRWDLAALPSGTVPGPSARPVGGDADTFGALPDRIVSTSSGTIYQYQYTGSHGAGYYLADCG